MTASAKQDLRDGQPGRQGCRPPPFNGRMRLGGPPTRPRGFSYRCACREGGAVFKPAPTDTERTGVSVRNLWAGLVLVLIGVLCLPAGAKLLIDVDQPTVEPMKIVAADFWYAPRGQG